MHGGALAVDEGHIGACEHSSACMKGQGAQVGAGVRAQPSHAKVRQGKETRAL